MTDDETAFPVMLSKEQVETILSCLRAGSMEPVSELIKHLERRLSGREKELVELKKLMDQPDYLVGI